MFNDFELEEHDDENDDNDEKTGKLLNIYVYILRNSVNFSASKYVLENVGEQALMANQMKYCLKEVTFLHHSVGIEIRFFFCVYFSRPLAIYLVSEMMSRCDCILFILSALSTLFSFRFSHSVLIMNLLM